MELMDCTAIEVRDALASGTACCPDLVEAWIERTQAAKALNCYAEFDGEGLRAQARKAHALIAAGVRLPLLGVPIALKDNIQAAGLQCGNGTQALHGHVAARDARLVRNLRAAGALVTGKLGMHELALGISSNNGYTGAIRNPWDTKRIAGGSSGGSGAAVSARLVPASVGTDTGGSVRVPAALCGVAGLRPTVGRISHSGLVPVSCTRDTAGPMAKSVQDLALLDSVLSGDWTPLQELPLHGLRLGVPVQWFWTDLAPGVEHCARQALECLRHQGVDLVAVSLPGMERFDAQPGMDIALHELARDLPQYLERHVQGVQLSDLVQGIASPDVAAIVVPLLTQGAVPQAAYRRALDARQRLQALYRKAFADHAVEALVFPTTPATAARIGEDEHFAHNGRPCPTFATFIRNTNPGSSAALPGLSLPIGLANGLPVGLALDGLPGSDRRLLAIGKAMETALPPMPLAPLL